jgi:hypothetical protein
MKMYTRETLEKANMKDLVGIAQELTVVGRHKMRKAELIEAIIQKQTAKEVISENTATEKAATDEGIETVKKTFEEAVEARLAKKTQFLNNSPFVSSDKKRYERTATVGMIVAFYINESLFSGMITEIHQEKFAIQTKNGNRFLVNKKDVAWYKTGKRWPKGIYEELTRRGKNARAKQYSAISTSATD